MTGSSSPIVSVFPAATQQQDDSVAAGERFDARALQQLLEKVQAQEKMIRDQALDLAIEREKREAAERQNAELRRRESLAERKLEATGRCVLTNIANRAAFNEEGQHRQRRADKKHEKLYFIMIDLTKFKSINDTYGHEGGDIVLKQVAIALKNAVRKQDMAVHFSGDEYGVLISGDDAAARAVYARVEKLLDRLLVPLNDKADTIVTVQGNLGMAEYEPGEGLQSLVTRADLAMYENKKKRGIDSRNTPRGLTV